MKNAILLHGLLGKEEYYDPTRPTGGNSHWFPWLQKQLIINEIKTDTPEIPHPYEFNWDFWVKEVERFEITPETILVGHSMGGGFLLGYLSKHPEIIIDQLVLVAPWINSAHEEDTSFFDFDIDPKLIKRVNKIIIFESDNDDKDVQNSVNFIKQKFPTAHVETFHNYGHFTLRSMNSTEFPELLTAITKP